MSRGTTTPIDVPTRHTVVFFVTSVTGSNGNFTSTPTLLQVKATVISQGNVLEQRTAAW